MTEETPRKTYTIRSATWGNAKQTSAVIITDEVAAVAISEVDTPEEWEAFLKWTESNPVSPRRVSVATPGDKLDNLLKRTGITREELKTLLK